MPQPILLLILVIAALDAAVIQFAGVPNDSSLETAWKNGALLNATLNGLKPGDELIFPAGMTYHLMGGIMAAQLRNNVIRIDSTLVFVGDVKSWPRRADGHVLECLFFDRIVNVTFTSSKGAGKAGGGTIDGSGETWWGLLKYAEIGENRPRLFSIGDSQDLLVENLLFKNSPYWTVWIYNVDGLEIRYSEISNRRDNYDGHDIYNLGAFNTDGFDVTGRNVWIHDSTIWNQDDCIAVKDDSQDMLFERINASGLGLAIGSIGESTVRNITFRDCYMHHTFKGIYTKFRGSGLIADVLYENIVMDAPEQWAIWIGPAQQADSAFVCDAHPCSLCWPDIPFAACNMPNNASYVDITLRNITIIDPWQSVGIVFGSPTNPMQRVLFDGVVAKGYYGNDYDYYLCSNVASGVATGGTSPVPSCFSSK